MISAEAEVSSAFHLHTIAHHPGATVEAFASGGRPRHCRGIRIFVGGERIYGSGLFCVTCMWIFGCCVFSWFFWIIFVRLLLDGLGRPTHYIRSGWCKAIVKEWHSAWLCVGVPGDVMSTKIDPLRLHPQQFQMCNVHFYGFGWMFSAANRFTKVCLCRYLQDHPSKWLVTIVNDSACRVVSFPNGLSKWGWSQPLTNWLGWFFKYEHGSQFLCQQTVPLLGWEVSWLAIYLPVLALPRFKGEIVAFLFVMVTSSL